MFITNRSVKYLFFRTNKFKFSIQSKKYNYKQTQSSKQALKISSPAENTDKVQENKFYQNKMQFNISKQSILTKKLLKKKRTGREQSLYKNFQKQWALCFIVALLLNLGGHTFFPQTILSTNIFQKDQFDYTRMAEKQILSGKYGQLKEPHKQYI